MNLILFKESNCFFQRKCSIYLNKFSFLSSNFIYMEFAEYGVHCNVYKILKYVDHII